MPWHNYKNTPAACIRWATKVNRGQSEYVVTWANTTNESHAVIYNWMIVTCDIQRGLEYIQNQAHFLLSIEWLVMVSWCVVGRFRGDDPCFGDSKSDWVPILYISTIQLNTSFCRKNRLVSITFSSRDTKTYNWSNFSPKCII